MLKDLYRSYVIARAATAANTVIQNMNKRQLEYVGINPDAHVKELMARMHADFEAQDAKAKSVITAAVPLSV